MTTHTNSIYAYLFLLGAFLPGTASAASIYFETSRDTVSVGDTVIVSAKIDTENTTINSVEGDVSFGQNNGNVVVNDFSLAKSIFSLWPRTPSLSADGNTISFVGGVPGGFDLNKAVLFTIVIEAQKEGNVTISPQNIAMYANDGKGTRVAADAKSLTVHIVPKDKTNAPINEWKTIVGTDKISPEKFTIVIGREASLFEGKRFAFFTAVDNQSGVSYYEVSEDGKPPVRSGSMYVLQNQDEHTVPDLTVTVYDKAGNKTTSIYSEPSTKLFGIPFAVYTWGIIGVIVVIVILWGIKMRNEKRSRSIHDKTTL